MKEKEIRKLIFKDYYCFSLSFFIFSTGRIKKDKRVMYN